MQPPNTTDLDPPAGLPDALRPPSVDRLLAHEALQSLIASHGRTQVLDATRAELADPRVRATRGAVPPPHFAMESLACAIAARLAARDIPDPAARLQPHRHDAAHQPGPRTAAGAGY